MKQQARGPRRHARALKLNGHPRRLAVLLLALEGRAGDRYTAGFKQPTGELPGETGESAT